MNSLLRLLALVAYVAISVALVLLFGGNHSSGPMHSLFVLTSWGFFIFAFLRFPSWLFIFMTFFVYLLSLFFLNNYLRQRARSSVPKIPCLIHGVGILFCVLAPGREELETGLITNLLAWIIPLGVAFFYLYLDWELARKGRRQESTT